MAENEETHLLLYRYVEGMLEKRAPHREAHLAHLKAQREAGQLLIAGAYGDPPAGGVIGFRGVPREHVEAFVAADPYNRAGLVAAYEIHPWKLV